MSPQGNTDSHAQPDSVRPANTAQANAAQAEAWNGPAADHRIVHKDRHEAQYRGFSERLLASCAIEASQKVLDVGCGCGMTTLQAARLATDGYALGVDLSTSMLAEARREASATRVANATFLQADAQVYPFPTAEFDVVLSRLGVMFFADPRAAFANLARSVRSGGRLAFLCWQELAASEYLALTFQAIAPYVTPPPPAGPGRPGPYSLADPEYTKRLVADAGFDAVEVTSVVEPMWMGTDLEDAIAYRFSTPQGRAMFASIDEDTRARALDALRETLRPRLTPDGIALNGAAWLVTARKPAA
jgi:SAM-dependent methyltransferase